MIIDGSTGIKHSGNGRIIFLSLLVIVALSVSIYFFVIKKSKSKSKPKPKKTKCPPIGDFYCKDDNSTVKNCTQNPVCSKTTGYKWTCKDKPTCSTLKQPTCPRPNTNDSDDETEPYCGLETCLEYECRKPDVCQDQTERATVEKTCTKDQHAECNSSTGMEWKCVAKNPPSGCSGTAPTPESLNCQSKAPTGAIIDTTSPGPVICDDDTWKCVYDCDSKLHNTTDRFSDNNCRTKDSMGKYMYQCNPNIGSGYPNTPEWECTDPTDGGCPITSDGLPANADGTINDGCVITKKDSTTIKNPNAKCDYSATPPTWRCGEPTKEQLVNLLGLQCFGSDTIANIPKNQTDSTICFENADKTQAISPTIGINDWNQQQCSTAELGNYSTIINNPPGNIFQDPTDLSKFTFYPSNSKSPITYTTFNKTDASHKCILTDQKTGPTGPDNYKYVCNNGGIFSQTKSNVSIDGTCDCTNAKISGWPSNWGFDSHCNKGTPEITLSSIAWEKPSQSTKTGHTNWYSLNSVNISLNDKQIYTYTGSVSCWEEDCTKNFPRFGCSCSDVFPIDDYPIKIKSTDTINIDVLMLDEHDWKDPNHIHAKKSFTYNKLLSTCLKLNSLKLDLMIQPKPIKPNTEQFTFNASK